MSITPAASALDEDLEATAELPVIDFAAVAEDALAAGASTDIFPVPVIPVGTSDLADRLREVEQRLYRKGERLRQTGILLDQAGERQAVIESQLIQSRARQAELETQLEAARNLARLQSQLAVENKVAATRHHARDFMELRRRSERLLEALTSWQGFRSVSDALLADAEARNALLESQLAIRGDSLRAGESRPVRATIHAESDQYGANAALRAELAALQAELLVARQRQQQSAEEAAAAAARAQHLETEIHASVVIFGDPWKNPQLPDPGDTGTVARSNAPLIDAPQVLVRQDETGERVYPIGRHTTIGRTPDNDIQIDARNVSRHHAVLLTSSDRCIVEDLNSTNGVLVNGHRVVRQALHDGDIVTVGKTRFSFRYRT